MLFSIIFAVVAALLVIIAEAMFEDSEESISDYGIVSFIRENATSRSWERAIAIGLIVGAIRYFAPMAPWTGIVCFIATIGLLVYLCYYWQAEGSEIRELVCFVLLAILVFIAGGKATGVVAGLIKGGFFKFVLGRLPLATLVGSIGYMLCNFLHYRAEECAEDDEEEALYSRWTKIVAVLTAVAVILVFAIGANWSAVNFGHKKAEDPVVTEEPTETVAPTEEPEDWFGFYNTNLLLDDEPSNDFNFGWNPYDENTVGKSYDEDLRSRMRIDPALGAATMAWFDANLGTRFIGVFYDEVDSKWDAAINLAKERFMADQDEYNRTLEAFFKYLDASVKEVKVEEKKNIADQMYMNPYTSSGTPDVIVVETPDHEGHFLIYTLKVKETGIFEVAFRIDCGYQPCDVEKVMHITPQPVETIARTVASGTTATQAATRATTNAVPGLKSSGGGSAYGSRSSGGSAAGGRSSGGSSSGGVWYGGRPSGGGSSGSRGGGGGSSRTTNPKDTTKGTDVGKNDTTGPGPNTNNGIGATGSSAELPTNSSKKSSVGGSGNSYDAAIKQNEEANRTTRTGSSNGSSSGGSSGGAGSSNTPSSTRSGTDNVDSNAEKGTGHGGIDTPTTKTETHVQTSDGSTHSVSNDSPGTSWSGPVD